MTDCLQMSMVKSVTPELLRKASEMLKPGKSDPQYTFSTDCFKNGPDTLFDHLSCLLQASLVHSHFALKLLISTMIPLIKDRHASITTSKNYRSVALSSTILKLFDWVVILLNKESLLLNELQFAYQRGTSTVMCTWAARRWKL